jgi:hypothetical protein
LVWGGAVAEDLEAGARCDSDDGAGEARPRVTSAGGAGGDDCVDAAAEGGVGLFPCYGGGTVGQVGACHDEGFFTGAQEPAGKPVGRDTDGDIVFQNYGEAGELFQKAAGERPDLKVPARGAQGRELKHKVFMRGAVFGGENLLHRIGVAGVRAKAEDGFGAEYHDTAVTDNFRGKGNLSGR